MMMWWKWWWLASESGSANVSCIWVGSSVYLLHLLWTCHCKYQHQVDNSWYFPLNNTNVWKLWKKTCMGEPIIYRDSTRWKHPSIISYTIQWFSPVLYCSSWTIYHSSSAHSKPHTSSNNSATWRATSRNVFFNNHESSTSPRSTAPCTRTGTCTVCACMQ